MNEDFQNLAQENKQVTILTQPFLGNYGGMLQAYALSRSCLKIGVCPRLFNHDTGKLTVPQWRRLAQGVRDVLHLIRLNLSRAPKFYPINYKLRSIIAKKFETTFFPQRLRRAPVTNPVFVVGSDQVWRRSYAAYSGGILHYFLNFVPERNIAKSISYAASFGTDEWEGTPEETQRCGELLRQFKAVSVREFSGVRICKEVFGVDAVQMPDPTLLATLEDYEHVVNSEKTRVPKAPYFTSYVLDDSAEASQLLNDVEKSTGLYHQRLMPKSTARKRCDRFYCTVAQWLRYLRDCDAVVTDSFHGCVFSIIYNKPFVCLGNAGRGSARFDTLFQVFGLEDRQVSSRDREEVLRVLRQPIDWARVNAIHEVERRRGLDFLRSNLYDGASPDEQG